MSDSVKIICIVLVCCIGAMIGLGLFPCSLPDPERIKRNVEFVGVYKQIRIELIKIRDCEYVLWENVNGLDMEHYAGCMNTEHTEFHDDAARGMRLMWEDEE